MGSFDLRILEQGGLSFEDLKTNVSKVAHELERDRKALKHLKSIFRDVPSSILEQTKHEKSLSNTIVDHAIPHTSDKETSECFSKYNDFINELIKLQESYSRQMKSSLCDPIVSTVNSLKNLDTVRKDWDSAKTEYERKSKKGVALQTEQPNLKRCAAEYFKKRQRAESGIGTNLAFSLIEFSQRQTEYFQEALELSKRLQIELEQRQPKIAQQRKNDEVTLQRLDEISKKYGGSSHNESYSVHQNLIASNSSAGETKKGTVFVKRRHLVSIVQGFKKRVAHVREDGYFEIYHNNAMETRINLLTSSVKRDQSDRKAFELTAAEKNKPYIIMGTTEPETENWVQVIQNAKNALLNKYFEPSVDELTKKILAAVKSVPGNDCCADCGSRAPTWLSLNLGILVCDFCAGVHREIGVNFSKIRSITLDEWGTANLLVARNLGNEIFNEVYEANLHLSEKPDTSSSSEHRTNFIKQKYIHKRFIQKTVYSEQEGIQALESAIQESDIHAILQAYAEGAKPEARRDQIGLSCLHLAVEFGQLHIVEFLLQNAKDSPDGPVDSRGNTLLHHALEHYCGKDLCKLILRKYPNDAFKSNYLGKLPSECTNSNEIKASLRDIEGQPDKFKLLNVDYQWNFERSNGESDDEGLDDPASMSMSRSRPMSTSTNPTPSAKTPNTPSLTTFSSMDPPSTDANFLDRSTADSITSSPMKTSSPSRSKSQRTNSSSSNKILQHVPQFTTKNEDVMDQLRQRLKDPNPSIPRNIALVPDRHTPDRPVARTRGSQSTKEPRVKLRPTGSNSFRDNRRSQGDSLNRSTNYRNSAEFSNPTPKARTIIPSIHKSHSPSSTLVKRDSHDYAEVGILDSTKTSPSSRSNTFQSQPSPNNSLSSKDDYKRKSRSLESTLRSVDSSNNSSVSRNSSFSSRTSRQKPPSEPEQAILPEPVLEQSRLPSRVRAIYDCDADDDDELTFVVGEYITITREEEEGWLHGHIESQPHRAGLLPQIFVEILEYR